MLKAVLFDLDGTLVDTEKHGIEIAYSVLEKRGLKLDENEKQLFIGIRDSDFYTIIGKRYGLPEKTINELIAEHAHIYDRYLQAGASLFTGARELLRFCKETKLKTAIVSGSTKKEIVTILNQHELADFIDHIVSAEDVSEGKPDPAGYNQVLAILGLEPRDAIGIEDSIAGITSLKTAGIFSIGIEQSNQNLALADMQSKSLSHIQTIIQSRLF
jgi:HAD superfamily hydrolase (TIGR01509 family)